ncbi:GntR family transcriptional regulator [Streptomyces sp. NPDC058665]|uniref:GntR family transcriptional regulator n=1 Tax=Streptomyces sp. NPDC058665 TaxID=3346586 RepID=UPI00365041B5
MLEPVVRPASLTDLAHSQLREGILAGRLLNGERLSVVALADRLGMSRSPVRSAVERLVAEGLVNLQPAGVTLVQHSHADLLQLLKVRTVLEGLSARLAAPRVEPDTLAGLEEIHAGFERAVEESDFSSARALDLEFHQSVMGIGGNPYLIEDLTRIQARVIVGTYTIAWSPAQRQAVAEHRAILDALGAGEATEAETQAVRHMERLMERIEAAAG